MITLAPKMYFGVANKTKSVLAAKNKLMKRFNVVKYNNGKNNYQKPDDSGNFIFDFELDHPIGIKFTDLYEIYNSIPKNLIKEYEKCLEGIKNLDPNKDGEEEKFWFYNMRSSEFADFIESYLEGIRNDANDKHKETMEYIDSVKNEKADKKSN